MALVNIPRSNTDKFYRYKMPVMQLKIEGKGNGIRTVVTNMEKVMKALDRPPEHGVKFIGFELGTKNKYDPVQHSCMFAGKHDVDKLAVLLDKFIVMYVLCIKCGNPETIMKVKGTNIASKCKACGKVFKLDATHKLSNFIVKGVISKQVKEKEVKIIKVDDPLNDEWTYDTSEQAVMMRKQDLFGIEHVYPEEKLSNYIQTTPVIEKVIADLNKLKMSQDWSDNALIKYVFKCFFMVDIRINFYHKIAYLKPFINSDKDMILILTCIEVAISENDWYFDTTNILSAFYEDEVLEEDIILKWYSGKSKAVSEEIDGKIKSSANEFIYWLENAEYETPDVIDVSNEPIVESNVFTDIFWLEQDDNTLLDNIDDPYNMEITI